MFVPRFSVLWVALLCWPADALATTYNNRVCIDVDVQFADADFGTRWTDDSTDQAGRGFKVRVTHQVGQFVSIDWPGIGMDGHVETDGTFRGCTDDIAFDTALAPYTIRVWSEAKVGNVTLSAVDGSPYVEADESTSGYTPSSDADVGIELDGSDPRWNVLATTAYALALHNPTSGPLSWQLRMDACPGGTADSSCAAESTQRIYYGTPFEKYIPTHELGHLVSYAVDAGGIGCRADYDVAMDGCDGHGVGTSVHKMLTKEYMGTSGCEGVADFFSAMTFSGRNDLCEIATVATDFDLDLADDYLNNEAHPCYGDPWSPGGADPVTDGDWLEDLVNADDDGIDFIQCMGPLENRSTQFDWLRYFWGMWTVEDVDLDDMWDIWDAANPHDWAPGDTGLTGDFANERMEDAASTTFATEHANQAVHGLEH